MTEPKQRRTVKRLIAVIQDKIDRDVELLNKQSSEVSHMRGQADLLGGMLRDTQTRYEAAEDTLQGFLESHRERSAHFEALRDLLKDFGNNGGG